MEGTLSNPGFSHIGDPTVQGRQGRQRRHGRQGRQGRQSRWNTAAHWPADGLALFEGAASCQQRAEADEDK
eukprot:2536609-Karenia_brevis.AAC.1